MNFRDFIETWDAVGTGATPEDEQYAQNALRAALVSMVKDPYADYKRNRLYIGKVEDFFPKASQLNPSLGTIPVFFDPKIGDDEAAAHTNGRSISVGKMGYKHRGSSGSLGATFIHEVEHVWDYINNQFASTEQLPGGATYGRLSEFTPRLRQMLRQLKDQPGMRIWNYIHRKNGRWHVEDYVDRYLDGTRGYQPTEEEREFAIQAVQKRAQEIYDRMVANGEI